jgi:hypothetical protein
MTCRPLTGRRCSSKLRIGWVQKTPRFIVLLAVSILREFRRAATEMKNDLIGPKQSRAAAHDIDVTVV